MKKPIWEKAGYTKEEWDYWSEPTEYDSPLARGAKLTRFGLKLLRKGR